MPLRLSKYMLAILSHHLENHRVVETSFIYPILFYTGDRAYSYSTDFFDFFGDFKELAREILSSPYPLVDLSQISDEELMKGQMYGTMAFIMKHIRDPDLLDVLNDVCPALKKIKERGEEKCYNSMISYIYHAGEAEGGQAYIDEITKQLETESEGKTMKIADYLRGEGRAEGISEGISKGVRKVAQSMLQESYPVESISKITSLSEAEIRALG